MEQKFLAELFRLTFVHKYYKDNITGVFSFEPTDPGIKTLSSYELSFKPKKDGFVVVCPCKPADDQGNVELKNQFNEDAKLSFVTFNHDNDFFENSNLPFDPPGEYVYYFNNLDENQRNTYLLLDKKGIEESERIKLHDKKFSGEIEKYKNNRIIKPKVFDCSGKQINEIDYDLDINTDMGIYTLDLTRLPDGLYTIQYNENINIYYCAKPSFIRCIPLIVVEIFINKNVPAKYSVVEWINNTQYISQKKFILHFGDYSLYWRYNIIPKKISNSIFIKVLADDSNYTFSPEKEKISNNIGTVLFTSSQLMDKNSDEYEINLYRVSWNDKCKWENKYYYCDKNYGILINNKFMCRKTKKVSCDYEYTDKCPAESEDKLIGRLPVPDEVATIYYYEDDKHIAEMTMYLVKKGSEYLITDNYEPWDDFTHQVIEQENDSDIEFITDLEIEWVHCRITIYDENDNIKIHWCQIPMIEKTGNTYRIRNIAKSHHLFMKLEEGDKIIYSFIYRDKNEGEVITDEFTYKYQGQYLKEENNDDEESVTTIIKDDD